VEIDALWQRAMEHGDALDLGVLADREGAAGLLQGVEQGGQVGRTALLALPYALDAETALQRLGEIALQTDDGAQREVIETIQDVVQRMPYTREPLDAPGVRACGEALVEIAKGRGVKANRALAVSVARLLVDRMAIDPASIPTEFDSP
jgi:hypothetical protein